VTEELISLGTVTHDSASTDLPEKVKETVKTTEVGQGKWGENPDICFEIKVVSQAFMYAMFDL